MTILGHWEKNKLQAQRSLAGLDQITSKQEWQNSAAGNAKLQKRAKEWVERRKTHNQAKPSPQREQALKNGKSGNSSRHKKPRMGSRMCRQASRPQWTHKQQADFGHTQKWSTRKAQTSPACTQPIQEVGWLWVRGKRAWSRGKRAWSSGGEMGKTYSGVYLGSFGRNVLLG